jgi:hypothetical protein
MLMNLYIRPRKEELLASLVYQFRRTHGSSRRASRASYETSWRKMTSADPVVLMACRSADMRSFGYRASAFTFQLMRRKEPDS